MRACACAISGSGIPVQVTAVRHARLVVIIEANLCHVRANHIWTAISSRYPEGHCIAYSDDASDRGRLGVWVDDVDKERYVNMAISYLVHGTVHLHKPFIGSHGLLVEFHRQMCAYRVRVCARPRGCAF